MIKVCNISKSYKSSFFKLENISFQLKENETLGLIGRNGTGKSTILKMMNRLVDYDSGEIQFEGVPIHTMNESQQRTLRKQITYIFQNGNLLETQSVYYHLSLVYKLNKQKVNEQEIDDLLKFLEIPQLKYQTVYYLSGGQKQKVAIAMALLAKPKVILCDEISSQLDINSEQEIFKLLKKIKESTSISMIVISHNLEILKNFCDKILLISDNTITKEIIPNQHSNKEIRSYEQYVEEYLYD